MKKLLIGLALLAGVLRASALTVDSTVSDHCVLLQNAQNVVKGTTTTGKTVTVTLGGSQVGSATADSSGNYKVSFNPGAANATGRNLVVSDGSATLTISDVLVGEVWLVAGQSNAYNSMDFSEYEAQFATWMRDIDYPKIRVATSQMKTSTSWGFSGPGDPARADISIPLVWEVVSAAVQSPCQKRRQISGRRTE